MGRSPGLIITLIVFIILTLTLGVVTYFMAQGYKETVIKFNTANKEVAEAKTSIAKLNADIQKLVGLIGGYRGKPDNIDCDQFSQDCQKVLSQAMTDKTPAPKTYNDCVAMLKKNLKAKDNEVKLANVGKNEAEKKAADERTIRETQKKTFDDQRKTADTTFAKQKDADQKKVAELESTLKTQISVRDKIQREAANLNKKYRQEAADANERTAAITRINIDINTKLDELSRTDFEVPDGKVLFVNQKEKTLRLDIGKADGVRLLTNFGVYPYNTLDLGHAESKGTVEIIRIMDEHLCEARIIEDEISNPIMPGDMIYTPLWKTGEEVLIALTYHLDVDGDGKDDLALLKNLIDASGAKVVFWVDENGERQGKLTPAITSIITSDESITDILARDNIKDQKLKDLIFKSHMQLLQEANQNNIKEVKLAEFLRKIHYKRSTKVSRFQEEGGLGSLPMGNATPEVSTAPMAPIYIPGKQDKPPVSSAPTAPIYDTKNQKRSPASSGKVSDYYFQKRTP